MQHLLVTQLVKGIEDRGDNYQSGSCAHFFYEINIFLLILLPNWKDFQWAGTYY